MSGDAELVRAFFDAAFAPVKDVFLRLLGPASDELSGIIADPIRAYRFRQSVGLLEKFKRVCDETGFQPNAVPLKTLLPILEHASLEHDQDLHDRWANLLANASGPNRARYAHSSFPEILTQLSNGEVHFLDYFCEKVIGAWNSAGGGKPYTPAIGFMFPITGNASLLHDYIESTEDGGYFGWLAKVSDSLPTVDDTHTSFSVAVDNLLRLRLIESAPLSQKETKQETPTEEFLPTEALLPTDARPESKWFLTALGFEFVSACRRPR